MKAILALHQNTMSVREVVQRSRTSRDAVRKYLGNPRLTGPRPRLRRPPACAALALGDLKTLDPFRYRWELLWNGH